MSAPLRVVMVSCDYYPKIGGIAGHIRALARELARRGHAVSIVHHHYGKGPACRWNDGGVPVYESGLGLGNWPMKATLPLYWATGGWTLRRALVDAAGAERMPAIVHVHDLLEGLGLVAFSVTGRGHIVLTNHSSTYLMWTCSRVKIALLRRFARPVEVVIAPSRELERESARLHRPVVYVPNGVDEEVFHPPGTTMRKTARARLGAVSRSVLLCPRRLVWKNGVDLLIEALKSMVGRHADLVAVLAGSGPEERRLRARADSLGLTQAVCFLGDVPHRRMAELYAAADLVVIPSRLEATSLAALEAGACGVAVVAARVGGLPEVVADGESGLLVEPDDPIALASAIDALLCDPARRAALGAGGRALVCRRFGWKKIAEETEAVYLRALGERGEGA